MFPQPAPGFDQPLSLLRACHGRILAHCETLLRLAQALNREPIDLGTIQAADRIRTYFSTAGRMHHEDEEADLFPLLLAMDPSVAEPIWALQADHITMGETWTDLERTLANLEGVRDIHAFANQAKSFHALYQRHIQREESLIIDRAERVLSRAQLDQLGHAMALRRGVAMPVAHDA